MNFSDVDSEIGLDEYLNMLTVDSHSNTNIKTTENTFSPNMDTISIQDVQKVILKMHEKEKQLLSKVEPVEVVEASLVNLEPLVAKDSSLVNFALTSVVPTVSFTLPFERKVTTSTQTTVTNSVSGSIPTVVAITGVSTNISSPFINQDLLGGLSDGFINDNTNRTRVVPNPITNPIVDPTITNTNKQQVVDTSTLQKQLALITEAVGMLTVLVKNAQKPKVVPPEKFQFELGHDLDKFFTQFERYSKQEYPGSNDQWVILLSKYLDGSFLKLYTMLRKHLHSYEEVKGNLVKWFRHEERRKNKHRLQEFMNAARIPGESINLFALRLEQLALKAFPGVEVRSHDSLRTAFLLSLPKQIENKLREYILQSEIISQTKVPWDQLVLLADSYDHEHFNINSDHTSSITEHELNAPTSAPIRDIETIHIDTINVKTPTWADKLKNSNPRIQTPRNGTTQKQTFTSRSGRSGNQTNNNSYFQPRYNPPVATELPVEEPQICDHCGLLGHDISVCYKYLGICSYCKRHGHIRAECRFIQSPTRKPFNRRPPCCPFCKGAHFGINCPSKNTNRSEQENPRSGQGWNTNSSNNVTNITQHPNTTRPNNVSTYTNSQLHTTNSNNNNNNNTSATGTLPKKQYIKDCNLCGNSHYEGQCFGEHLNGKPPQG